MDNLHHEALDVALRQAAHAAHHIAEARRYYDATDREVTQRLSVAEAELQIALANVRRVRDQIAVERVKRVKRAQAAERNAEQVRLISQALDGEGGAR